MIMHLTYLYTYNYGINTGIYIRTYIVASIIKLDSNYILYFTMHNNYTLIRT